MAWKNLPGVKGDLDGGLVNPSITAFMTALRHGRIASSADGSGSCTVYLDDAGAFRCTFHRYLVALDETTVKTKSAVKVWLAEWLPKIH